MSSTNAVDVLSPQSASASPQTTPSSAVLHSMSIRSKSKSSSRKNSLSASTTPVLDAPMSLLSKLTSDEENSNSLASTSSTDSAGPPTFFECGLSQSDDLPAEYGDVDAEEIEKLALNADLHDLTQAILMLIVEERRLNQHHHHQNTHPSHARLIIDKLMRKLTSQAANMADLGDNEEESATTNSSGATATDEVIKLAKSKLLLLQQQQQQQNQLCKQMPGRCSSCGGQLHSNIKLEDSVRVSGPDYSSFFFV